MQRIRRSQKKRKEKCLFKLKTCVPYQCTLQCMGRSQKCNTGIQIFSISKLGGWKQTTAFHKSFEMNGNQTLKNLWQYWCYGNQSVIDDSGGRWKHYTKTGARTSAVLLRTLAVLKMIRQQISLTDRLDLEYIIFCLGVMHWTVLPIKSHRILIFKSFNFFTANVLLQKILLSIDLEKSVK